MQIVAALVAGLLFGAGLTVAQMVDPRKILDFLDVAGIATGRWDPSLLMVFIGALPTMFAAYMIQKRWSRPILAPAFPRPVKQVIDAPLVGGSVIFGVGWGLAGVCPGPALTAVTLAGEHRNGVILFVAAMIAGILLSGLVRSGGFAVRPSETATEPRS